MIPAGTQLACHSLSTLAFLHGVVHVLSHEQIKTCRPLFVNLGSAGLFLESAVLRAVLFRTESLA